MKHLLAVTIALLPSAVLAQQFTPEQMLDVMTQSPENRDVRVHDGPPEHIPKKGPDTFPKGTEAPGPGRPDRHYPDGRRIPGRI